MPTQTQVPVTVLTGYLGAGKTTLLNHILTAEHGRKVAVIVNEFGEIGIDQQLVINADEEIFEMNNGCICCTVRGDLIRIIGNLMRRRHKFDHLLIETTGLADPGPVIQTFFVDEDIQQQMSLDAVVTVVDAKHIQQHWGDREALEQIAFADVILLNKTDLVSEADLKALEAKIQQMNAIAKIHRVQLRQPDEEQIKAVLDVGGFDLERILAIEPDFLGDRKHEHDHHEHEHEHEHHDHEHDQSIASVGIAHEGTVDPQRFHDWINNLLQTQGPDIFRMKGIINIAGEENRFVFQGVHMIFDGVRDRAWRPDETRRNQLVFIGRNLDADKLKQAFLACLT
jgi:G3E family GTPase